MTMPDTSYDPHTVRLWLATRRPDGNADTLWTKTIRTAHAPGVDDEIFLWDDDGDDFVGAKWPVRNRFFNASGLLNVELVHLVHNPEPDVVVLIRQGLRDGSAHYGMPYRSDPGDPPPGQLLAAAGWCEWDPRP